MVIALCKSCSQSSRDICAGSPISQVPWRLWEVMTGVGDGLLCYRSRVLCLGAPLPSIGSRGKLPCALGERSPHPLRPPAANTTLPSGLCVTSQGRGSLVCPTGTCLATWDTQTTSSNNSSFIPSIHLFKCLQSPSVYTELDIRNSSEEVLSLGGA